MSAHAHFTKGTVSAESVVSPVTMRTATMLTYSGWTCRVFQEENDMANAFVHVELNTTDVDKAKGFYGKLFDWQLEDVDMGDMTYTMIKTGTGTGGGIMKHPMPGERSIWLAYVDVADIKAATAKA